MIIYGDGTTESGVMLSLHDPREVGQANLVRLLYAGWQVYDGLFETVSIGSVLEAAIEFSVKGPIVIGEQDDPLGVRDSATDPWPICTGRVIAVRDVAVLDLGFMKAMTWTGAGGVAANLVEGQVITAPMVLGFDAWAELPWSIAACAAFSLRYQWIVRRISVQPAGETHRQSIRTVEIDTVRSSDAVWLECELVG